MTRSTPSDGSHTKPGVKILSSFKIQHKVIWAGGERDPIIKCTRWWIAHIFLILPTAVCTMHITYQWQRCNGLHKSNGSLTLIIPHLWFAFESLLDCIRWLFDKKKKKRQGQNTFRLNLKVLSLSMPCASIYHLIIQSENWGLKNLYSNKERGADYECPKCNFYYISIILLLITNSSSLFSSSKARLYSHVHTAAKKKLVMFNLLGWGEGG